MDSRERPPPAEYIALGTHLPVKVGVVLTTREAVAVQERRRDKDILVTGVQVRVSNWKRSAKTVTATNVSGGLRLIT